MDSKIKEAAIDCAKKATPPLNAVGAYQARDYVMFMEGAKAMLLEISKIAKIKDGDAYFITGRQFQKLFNEFKQLP